MTNPIDFPAGVDNLDRGEGWKTIRDVWQIHAAEPREAGSQLEGGYGVMALSATPEAPIPDTTRDLGFSPEAYAQLEKIASANHISVGQAVSDAISLNLWIDKLLADGSKIIIKHPNGKREQLRPRHR
jgi:hypothetical protein